MATASSSKLFQSLKIGDITLQHRVVMAPLTRFRADDQHVHGQIGIDYYSQRSSTPGTLLITEATFIAPEASGYANAPGIWSDDQVAAWKKITDAVHANSSFIYLQLWALGRAADPQNIAAKGFDYVAPSAIPMTEGGPAPRPLSTEETKNYVDLYAKAAHNAVFRAGFDGVEIHAANGYLIDQFLQDVSNNRTDEYGGSIENRARFALEVVKAVTDVVGESKTGIRFSPWNTYQGMRMADPVPTYTHLVTEIRDKYPNFAYVHFFEPGPHAATEESNEFARELWQPRPFLSAGEYNEVSGPRVADEKDIAIVYGRWFISNPDLPLRLKNGIALTPYDSTTFYAHGTTRSDGYTDYPFAKEVLSTQPSAVTVTRIELSAAKVIVAAA